jgi:hypothetical protein
MQPACGHTAGHRAQPLRVAPEEHLARPGRHERSEVEAEAVEVLEEVVTRAKLAVVGASSAKPACFSYSPWRI